MKVLYNGQEGHWERGQFKPAVSESGGAIRGIGDLVAVVTKYTGIAWMVGKYTKLTGKDCGCQRRRERWNRWGKG